MMINPSMRSTAYWKKLIESEESFIASSRPLNVCQPPCIFQEGKSEMNLAFIQRQNPELFLPILLF